MTRSAAQSASGSFSGPICGAAAQAGPQRTPTARSAAQPHTGRGHSNAPDLRRSRTSGALVRFPGMELLDTRGRPVRDLRISITDRCNFRCTYCMPKEVFNREYEFLDRQQLLSFEEITRVARVFAGHGVHKIRITGGEPLLRRGMEDLVGMLGGIDEIDDLTLTTNGSLLAKKAVGIG